MSFKSVLMMCHLLARPRGASRSLWVAISLCAGLFVPLGATASNVASTVASSHASSVASSVASSLAPYEPLFNALEDAYPDALSPQRALTQAGSDYVFRYYSGSKSYLGVSNVDGHLYYMGATQGLVDLGLASALMPSLAAHGAVVGALPANALGVTAKPPQPAPDIPVPTGLTAMQVPSGTVTLNWDAAPMGLGVTQYQVYRTYFNLCRSSGSVICPAWFSATTLLGNVAVSNAKPMFTDTTATPDSAYDYTVAACVTEAMCSAQSVPASVNAVNPPISVTGVMVSLGGLGYGQVTSQPSGISCYAPRPEALYLVAPDCFEAFTRGTTVTLLAAADFDSGFVGWGGACAAAGMNPACTVLVSALARVTASFSNDKATAECFFAYAEATVPALLSPKGSATRYMAPYYFRYYPTSGSYLGLSTADGHAYYLAPGSAPLDLGLALQFLAAASCLAPRPSL